MLKIEMNKFRNFRNSHYTIKPAYLDVTSVKTRRSISVVISGSQNIINCRTQSFVFTDPVKFESYIGPFLVASKDLYPLTNRSTIDSTLLNIFYLALVFPLIFTTSCYDFIHDNQKSYNLSVGIAKVLEYVCVKTSKYSTGESPGSLNGIITSSYNLSSSIDFIENNFLNRVNINNKQEYSNDIKSLCRFIGALGYTINVDQLYNVLLALTIELRCLVEKEGVFDFDRMLTTISRLSSSLVKMPVVQFHTTKSSSDRVGIYKFRNSSSNEVYHVSPKGFASMDVSGQQASFIFLALFLPTYVTNGVTGPNINAEDMNLNASQHAVVDVLRALFSFQAQSVDVPDNPRLDGEGKAGAAVRHFSTHASSLSERSSSLNSKQSFSTYYHRCHIYCTKPLVLTLDQAFGPD
jgi:hypothetical protein